MVILFNTVLSKNFQNPEEGGKPPSNTSTSFILSQWTFYIEERIETKGFRTQVTPRGPITPYPVTTSVVSPKDLPLLSHSVSTSGALSLRIRGRVGMSRGPPDPVTHKTVIGHT